MIEREYFSVPWLTFQKQISDFTGANRDFTSYSSTKLDHIFAFYYPDKAGWMYSRYDTKAEALVFTSPINWMEVKGPKKLNFFRRILLKYKLNRYGY